MKRLVVGVIGHVDHGKTALVRALTGTDTDRLKEEKQRGISIALGFAHLNLGDDVVDLIDMPGHERFVQTMVSGATGIDAALVVVAANEGVKAQTIEHVEIAGLLGLRRAILVVNKIDLVDAAQARRAAGDAEALMRKAGLAPLRIVMTSSISMAGLEDLRAAIAALVEAHEVRRGGGLAYLPIDRAFSMAGHGPVVTGTLRGGPIAQGDALILHPTAATARVRAVQVHGERVNVAAPGQRVAVNLRDVDIGELKRGMALAAQNALAPSEWITVSVRALEGAPLLKNGARVRVLIGADEISARLRLLEGEALAPGEQGFAQLKCSAPVAAPVREPVVLRLASPPQTLAGGKILDIQNVRLKRRSEPVLTRLARLRDLEADALILAETQAAGRLGVSLQRLSRLSALAEPRVLDVLPASAVTLTKSGWLAPTKDFDELIAAISQLAAVRAEGVTLEFLTTALNAGALIVDEALQRLQVGGLIVKRGGTYLAPRPEEDLARTKDEEAIAARIAEVLRQGGLAPPTPKEIIADLPSKRAVDRLLREGVVIRAVDRAKDKEIFFHCDAIEDAQRRLRPLLDRVPGLLVTEIAAALGISRKYCMPLLDHLDTMRFTRRIQDRRMLGVAHTVNRG